MFDDPLYRLTTREREVFDLCVNGQSNKKIATALNLSIKTVETHRANINRKLNTHSSVELFRFAAFRGLITGLVPQKTGT